MTTTARMIELSETESMTVETTTPAPETGDADTTEKLAALGDDIKRAQEQRWKREQAEQRAQRQRTFAETRLRKIDVEIPELERLIRERQPVVDRLEEMFDQQQSQLQKLINNRGHVDARNASQYNSITDELNEIRAAMTQAMHTGSELVEGASAMEGGGGYTVSLTPMSRRIAHPLLDQIASDVDWATPLAPLVEQLETLKTERATLQQRLSK